MFCTSFPKLKELLPNYRTKRKWSFTDSELAENRNQSYVVGVSSCLIAFPGVFALPCSTCLYAPHGNYMFVAICINAAVWSFLADYTFAANSRGSVSTLGFDVHTVDRYNAFGSIVYVSIQFVKANQTKRLMPCLAILCAAFLHTRSSPNAAAWFIRHTIWHLTLVAILFYLIYLLDHE